MPHNVAKNPTDTVVMTASSRSKKFTCGGFTLQVRQVKKKRSIAGNPIQWNHHNTKSGGHTAISPYHRFTLSQREVILVSSKTGKTVREIANDVWCYRATVYRDTDCLNNPSQYSAYRAQEDCQARRHAAVSRVYLHKTTVGG